MSEKYLPLVVEELREKCSELEAELAEAKRLLRVVGKQVSDAPKLTDGSAITLEVTLLGKDLRAIQAESEGE